MDSVVAVDSVSVSELRELCVLCELFEVTVDSVPVSELDESESPVLLELDDESFVEISVVPVVEDP